MDYVIQVTDLVKSFGKETVLHHINMNFAPEKYMVSSDETAAVKPC